MLIYPGPFHRRTVCWNWNHRPPLFNVIHGRKKMNNTIRNQQIRNEVPIFVWSGQARKRIPLYYFASSSHLFPYLCLFQRQKSLFGPLLTKPYLLYWWQWQLTVPFNLILLVWIIGGCPDIVLSLNTIHSYIMFRTKQPHNEKKKIVSQHSIV